MRRVWFDSAGDAWIAEWNAGQLGRYEPDTGEWSEWALPGADPRAYAVYVDEAERVWLTDFGSNSIVLFEPEPIVEFIAEELVFPNRAVPAESCRPVLLRMTAIRRRSWMRSSWV